MSADGVWSGEIVYHRKDGEPLLILSAISMLKDADGKPLRVSGVHLDITERLSAEQTDKRARALRESDKRRSS